MGALRQIEERKIRGFVDTTLIAHKPLPSSLAVPLDPKTVPQCVTLVMVTNSALVGGYYLFWVSESQFPPYIRSTNVWGKAMEGR